MQTATTSQIDFGFSTYALQVRNELARRPDARGAVKRGESIIVRLGFERGAHARFTAGEIINRRRIDAHK